ncbi:MAG: LCP family protein [Oscillospiraceae bacterium]|nr:LCP family protein [Oscillospiraceae bacterium]
MQMKKAIRMRSNWYIYLLTFLVTFVILSFVVYNIWDFLFPARGSQVMTGSPGDFRPDASFNSTTLLMLSEGKGGIPEYYMLLNYRPRDEAIVLVPLRSNLLAAIGNQRGTLNDFYAADGSDGVMLALRNTLGITLTHYVKFDKESFIGFFDLIGNTPVNIPYDLTGGEVNFRAGSYEFTGDDLYSYITYPEYNQGEDYRLMLHGLTVSNFLNKNSRNLEVTQLQTFFNRILNTTDTNLDFSDFTKNQQAYLYTTQNSFDIADYYIPHGTTDESGRFTVAETAAATIRNRFGIRSE